MVQIIPRTRPTFGEQFSSGLVKGGEQGIQFGQQILSKSIENKMAQQTIAEKLAMLDKSGLFKDLPKEYAHLARLAASGAIEPGVATSIAEMLRQGQTQNEFNKYFGGGNEPQADYNAPGMRGAEDLSGGTPQGELPPEAGGRGQEQRLVPQSDYESKISEIQKAQDKIRPALKSKDKLIRDTAQASINDLDKQLQDIRNQQKFQFQQSQANQSQRQFEHEQSKDYAKHINETADKAKEVIDAAKEIKRISAKGTTGLSARNAIYSALKKANNPFASIFSTDDIQTIEANTKSLMGGTLKDIVGAKPTQSEFFWLENIVPNILKNASANEASANYFQKIGEWAEKRSEVYDDIVKENGGYRPIGIETMVRDRMRDYSNHLIEEGYRLSPDNVRVNILNPDTGEMGNIKANKFYQAKEEGFQIVP